MANGTQRASDNFTRGGYPVNLGSGDGWTTISGFNALSIASANTLQVSVINTNCGALWTGLTWANDQYSEITLGVVPPATADSSVYVRSDAGGQNCYRLDIHAGIFSLYAFNSGTPTKIKEITGQTVNSGDTFRLTAIGTTLIVTHNDTTVMFISDATVASGSAGVYMYNQLSTSTSSIASWRGGIPSGNTNGIYTKKGVVIPANSTDISAGSGIPGASNASILYEGNAQILSGNVFKAWFQGKANIYYAESTDGITWSRRGAAVISSVGIPRVYKNGATYYAHVTHTPGGPWTQIDQYTSSDGITWTLAHANILSVGGVGTWDHTFVGYFQVADIIAGTWYALYAGQNGGNSQWGLATSSDGVTWTKSGSNPVLTTASTFDRAIKIGSTYYFWLTEQTVGQTGGANCAIIRFHTTDFINWTRDAVALQPDSVDEGRNYASGQISVCSTLEVNGTTYQFYSASPDDPNGGSYQIRLATAAQTISSIVANQEYFKGYNQVASDNFTRADGSLGANWTMNPGSAGSLQIASHKAEPSTTAGTCGNYYSASTFNNDQYSEIAIATLVDSNSFTDAFVRQDAATNTHYGPSFSGGAGSVHTVGLYQVISGAVKQLGSNTTLTPQLGDKIRVSAVGTDISFFQNEHLLLQETDSGIASGYPALVAANSTAIANSQISLWTGGNVLALPANVYSVPDCRVAPAGPNASRNVQGTLIYDVQTSSNPAIPPVDSRRAGAPVDSRVSPNIPQNSRTPGTYGPGE